MDTLRDATPEEGAWFECSAVAQWSYFIYIIIHIYSSLSKESGNRM
jgi:hypothetical protein